MPLTDAQQVAINRQQSKTLGSVAAPSGDSAVTGQFGLATVTVQPGQSFPLTIEGDFLYILSITNTDGSKFTGGLTPAQLLGKLLVVDSNAVTMPIEEEGRAIEFPRPFTQLTFANNTVGLPVVFICFIGSGRIVREGRTVPTVGISRTSGNGIVRPNNATPYVAGQALTDVSGNALVVGSPARFPGGSGKIRQARLVKTSGTVLNADFTAFIYATLPVTQGDQSAYIFFPNQTLVGIIRFPSFITGTGGGSGAVCEVDGISVPFFLLTANPNSLFVQFVANAPYVPGANENFNLSFAIDQD